MYDPSASGLVYVPSVVCNKDRDRQTENGRVEIVYCLFYRDKEKLRVRDRQTETDRDRDRQRHGDRETERDRDAVIHRES